MIALKAQTGPVFRRIARLPMSTQSPAARRPPPLIDFNAADGVRHTIWKVSRADCGALVAAVGRIPALYIADGHHRAASAARTRTELHGAGESAAFLAVAFPDDQVQILPYNRIVKTLGTLTPVEFEKAVGERFDVVDGPASPVRRGDISMYFGGKWQTLRARVLPANDAIRSLDVSVLQEQLLAPVLGIVDVTTDKRIDFVGGARGTRELENLVDAGKAVAAFSMFPVSVGDLMTVADAGAIMPPKSTWFEEPKLRRSLDSPHMTTRPSRLQLRRRPGSHAASGPRTSSDLLALPGVGMSILEISHRPRRSNRFSKQTEADIRTLADILRTTTFCSCRRSQPAVFDSPDEFARGGTSRRLHRHRVVGGQGHQGSERSGTSTWWRRPSPSYNRIPATPKFR
jgi:hypothetical protein